jgi:hypothetical protein
MQQNNHPQATRASKGYFYLALDVANKPAVLPTQSVLELVGILGDDLSIAVSPTRTLPINELIKEFNRLEEENREFRESVQKMDLEKKPEPIVIDMQGYGIVSQEKVS